MLLNRSADYASLDARFPLAKTRERKSRSVALNLFKTSKDFIKDRVTERRAGILFRCPQPYHRGCSKFARPG